MLMKIMTTTAEALLICAFLGVIMSALLWADQKEKELGISGMSSDRILAQEENK